MKGNVLHLQQEISSGKAAAIVSSDNNLFATPNAPGEKIIVYGAQHQNVNLRQAVWIDASMFYGRSSFKKGERVDLRGFQQTGNKGIFEIGQVTPNTLDNSAGSSTAGIVGILYQLQDIPPSSAEPGQLRHLQYEANRQGGIVTGCFGKTVGPATAKDPIIVYGSSAASTNTHRLRFSPTFAVSAYEIGELIRLQHFKVVGNTGVFRIRSVQQNSLEMNEIKSCAATNLLCTGTIDNLIKESKQARKRDMMVRHVLQCPSHCFGHGRIDNLKMAPLAENESKCTCDVGFNPGSCCETRLPINTKAALDIHCPSSLSTQICSGHGTCNGISGVCACDNSWMSIDCAVPVLPCPNLCSSHGVCETASGRCHCDSSWTGVDCAVSNVFCPTNCCGPSHGACNHKTGRCTCRPGYSGMDCCSVSLPCCQGCSLHGTCDGATGQCKCNPGWGGDWSTCCAKKLCPFDCHSDEKHGVCVNGQCKCEPSFHGVACETSVLPCPNNCSGHGTCDMATGNCACETSWRGIDCGIPFVPCNCSRVAVNRTHGENATVQRLRASTFDTASENTLGGICDTTTGKMKCINHTFVGKCCQRIPCFNNCTDSAHGTCNARTSLCSCTRAWMSADCSVPKCGQHGVLLSDGSCRADQHYFSPIQGGICDRVGPLCRPDNRCVADQSSSDTCSSNAVGCSHVGACMCKMGWTGLTCENRLEPTGEQNLKNYKQTKSTMQPDKTMLLYKSAYLVYAEARFPTDPSFPMQEDFQVVFNLLGYSSQSPLEILADSKLILARGDINGDSKIQFNEFIKLGGIQEQPFVDLIPKAIAFVFRMLDYDGDAAVSFQDIAMSISRALAIAKWNRKIKNPKKDQEVPQNTLALGSGSILQGSRRCKMQNNPCDLVSPGDWLVIGGHDYDVYEVRRQLFAVDFVVLHFLLTQIFYVVQHKTVFGNTPRNCTGSTFDAKKFN